MPQPSLTKEQFEQAVKAYLNEDQFDKFGDLVCGKREPRFSFWATFAGPFWFLFHRMYVMTLVFFIGLHLLSTILFQLARMGFVGYTQEEIISAIIGAVASGYLAERLFKRFVVNRIQTLWWHSHADFETYLQHLKVTKSAISQKVINWATVGLVAFIVLALLYIYKLNPDALMDFVGGQSDSIGNMPEYMKEQYGFK